MKSIDGFGFKAFASKLLNVRNIFKAQALNKKKIEQKKNIVISELSVANV